MKELKGLNDHNNKLKVGIPRGLYYYHYPEMIHTFFSKLNVEVVLSKISSRSMLLNGLKYASDEECFSAKMFFGHIIDLKDRVDYLFLPKYHGNHKFKVSCPKFIGLPHVLQSVFSDLPKIIAPYHSRTKNHHHKLHLLNQFFRVGFNFTKNPFKIIGAIRASLKAQRKYLLEKHWSEDQLIDWETAISKSKINKVKVALLGHAYVLNDPILSFNTYNLLKQMGVEVITSEEMPESIIDHQLTKLHSTLYFEEESRIVGSALYFLETDSVDGILQIIPFPCGPTAVSSEIIMRHAKQNENMPLIQLMVDDNTGEAGYITRIEAFVMTMKRKKFLQYRKGQEEKQDISNQIEHVDRARELVSPVSAQWEEGAR
ncbi:MAG: hypothetical protein FK734_05805 [Asgard group archaeon]|nr:hypothetical protein [Asgard group archaeon]